MGAVTAISFFHHKDDMRNPADSDFIDKLLSGIKKLKPAVDGRKAVDIDILESLLCNMNMLILTSYDFVLYRALFLFTYYGCLRVGEVTKSSAIENVIKFDQVSFTHVKGKMQSVTIKFMSYKHSDTVKSRGKQKSALPSMLFTKKPDKRLCPVRAVASYIKLRGNRDGQFFINENGSGVTYNQFRSIMNQCLTKSDLSPKYFGTHSFRIGRCTDLHKAGFTKAQIKIMGRWKSNAFEKYIRPHIILV